MEIKKRDFLTAGLGIGLSAGLAPSAAIAQQAAVAGSRGIGGLPGPEVPLGGIGWGAWQNSGKQPSSVDMNYKPRRVNKAIELWEDGVPVYFTNSGMRPGLNAYEQGRKMAKTYADMIIHSVEHGPLDFTVFADFMCGLKDGGPTRSGHLLPCVIVQVPCIGLDEQYARANSWIVTNLLDLGAMGMHFGHMRDPMALEVYCQMAARYSFDYPDTPKVPRQGMGLRGQSAPLAASLWGVSDNKYLHVADLWPLNPRGEIIMGCSIADTFADANMAKTLAIKGLAFAEWGHNNQTQSVLGLGVYPEDQDRARPTPEQNATLDAIGEKVHALCRKNNVKFMGGSIQDGGMLLSGSEAAAIAGREMAKRKMPV
jgi:4-hydroxy-2-oxoheptanedioate aldolase